MRNGVERTDSWKEGKEGNDKAKSSVGKMRESRDRKQLERWVNRRDRKEEKGKKAVGIKENIWKWGKGRIERGDSLEKWLMGLYSN